MINDDDEDEILENVEAKTPSPLSSSADRSINEDEDNPRSDTSSDESSPSGLRKRLQHLPSPNQAARLASRVIDISRRLSRQREFYFQGETNRIIENIEKEEAELDSPGGPRRSYSDLKAKDARTRRRAKIRLENARNRAMVVPNPIESVSSTRNDSSSQRSEDRSSSTESRAKDRLEPNCERRSILDYDMSSNNAHRQMFYSLSARSPGLYRDRREIPCGDSLSQRGAMFLRPYPVSDENSPKDRMEPQSLSLPPSAKYRTCRGVILQNLSSGSEEAESSYEVTSDGREAAANQRIDRLMAATAREIGISTEVYETAKFQNDYSPPSRESSNRSLVDSSRDAYLENIVSSPSRMSFGLEGNIYPTYRTNDPPARFPTSMRQPPFYRSVTTSRSENGCRNDTMTNTQEEPMFYSAREEILQNYSKCPRTPNEASILPDTSPRTADTETQAESSPDAALAYGDTVVGRSYEEMLEGMEMGINERPQKCPGSEYQTQYPEKYTSETMTGTQYPDEYTSETMAGTRYPDEYINETMAGTQYRNEYTSETMAGTQYRNEYTSETMAGTQYRNEYTSETMAEAEYPDEYTRETMAEAEYPDEYTRETMAATQYPDEYTSETMAATQYPGEYTNETMTVTQYPDEYTSETMAVPYVPEDQTTLSPQPPETTVAEYPAFENVPEKELELDPSTITDAKALKQAISRCILSYDQDNETNFPPSDGIGSPPEPLGDRYCTSEDPSAGSTSRELYVGEFAPAETSSQNYYQPEYPDKSEMYEVTNDKEYANVPALALNSQEGSYSTSPASKGHTERLDTATLMVALSNASLKQQTTERISEQNSESHASPSPYVDSRTYSIQESASPSPRVDDKTVSRPESSENTPSLEEQSKSFNENRSKASCRSLGTRSKIPVKIPTHRSKLSIVSHGKSSETGRAGSQGTSPISSSKRSFKSSPSSPEPFHFSSARVASGRVQKTRANSSLVQSFKIIDKPKRSPVADTGDAANEIKRDLGCTKDEPTIEPPAVSLQVRTRDDDRSESKSSGNEENRDRGDSAKFHNDSCRSSNFSIGSKKHENLSQRSKHRSVSSNSESHSRSVEELVAELAAPESCVEPAIYIPKTPESPEDSPLLSYRANCYEGEVFEKLPDKRVTNLFENRIGDGSCNEVQSPEERKFESANSSPEKEEITEKSVPDNHDRLRFSLEKLAAEQFRRSIGEQTRSIRSDTAAFIAESYYECPQFSSSLSKLRCEKSRDTPRFKKRSQDRFPFTISEKTSVASGKFKAPGQLSDLNEDRDEARCEDADEEEDDVRYKLHVHPSITRLAGAGLKDSVADVISCSAEDELGDRRESSGMKKLVEKFSARWNRSKKRDQVDEKEPSPKSTNIIYRNRDYREECESSVESCSESSKEYDAYNGTDEKGSPKRSVDSPDEISSIVCERKSSIRECYTTEVSPRTPSSIENPCRRYDRDDLWVQAFKDLDSDREERDREIAEASENNESARSESKKDPYSLFFVKSGDATPETSGRELPSEDSRMQNVSTERRKNRVKFRSVVAPKRSDEGRNDSENEITGRESVRSRNSERVRKNRNLQTGCLCLRFYRMIVPISFGSITKYRSGTNRGSSSAKKKTRSCASPSKRKG